MNKLNRIFETGVRALAIASALALAMLPGSPAAQTATVIVNNPQVFSANVVVGQNAADIDLPVSGVDSLRLQVIVPVNGATLTLSDPFGAAAVVPTEPALTFLPGAVLTPPLPGGIFLTPTVAAPPSGTWKLRLQFPAAPEPTTVIATLFTATRYQAGMVLGSSSYRLGESISVGMIVLDNGAPITGLTPAITATPPSGPPIPLAALDNGNLANSDGLADDGVYSGRLDATQVGTYALNGQVSIPTANGSVERTASTTFEVTQPLATLGPVQATIARGAGNCVSRLDLIASGQATQAGLYVASAILGGSNGKTIERTTSVDLAAPGSMNFSLSYSSAEVRNAIGVSGPYNVNVYDVLSFTDAGANLEVRRPDAASFPAIQLSEFCTAPIEIAQQLTVTQTLRDGFIGSLAFAFPVTLAQAGTYQFTLKVTGVGGREVSQQGFTRSLAAGRNTVSFSLDSPLFQAIDGPYAVESVLITGQSTSAQASIVGRSDLLSRWQFFPRITGDLDGDGDVDAVDRDLLLTFRGKAAMVPGDRRDLLRDGTIDLRDARAIVSRLCAVGACPLN